MRFQRGLKVELVVVVLSQSDLNILWNMLYWSLVNQYRLVWDPCLKSRLTYYYIGEASSSEILP